MSLLRHHHARRALIEATRWQPTMLRDMSQRSVRIPHFGLVMPKRKRTIEFLVFKANPVYDSTLACGTSNSARLSVDYLYGNGNCYYDVGDVSAGRGRLTFPNPPEWAGEILHVALVYDADSPTAKLRWVVNGVTVHTSNSADEWPGDDVDLFIGNGAIGPFQGKLSLVRVWDIARTDAHIRATMHTIFQQPRPHLVGSWPLDDAASQPGDLIRDTSGFNRHGVLY